MHFRTKGWEKEESGLLDTRTFPFLGRNDGFAQALKHRNESSGGSMQHDCTEACVCVYVTKTGKGRDEGRFWIPLFHQHQSTPSRTGKDAEIVFVSA